MYNKRQYINKRRYDQATVVRALQMYTRGDSFKLIQETLDLPPGNTGESLISQWRKRSGINLRKKGKI